MSRHPAATIMSRRAAEAGIDIAAFNADLQQRAATTLIFEMLDLLAPQVLCQPELLPTVSLALHSYAELLERSEEIIDDSPEFQEMIKTVHEGDGS